MHRFETKENLKLTNIIKNNAMKTTKNLIVAVCLTLVASFTIASSKPTIKKSENTQIQNYLEKLEFNKVIKDEATLNIHFMINDANEIVVVSTTNPALDEIIKTGLNYKTLDVSNLEHNSLYIMPVRVVVKN
jgi:ATP:corrinoid adenosyltransferase